jgi:hypothetical protein
MPKSVNTDAASDRHHEKQTASTSEPPIDPRIVWARRYCAAGLGLRLFPVIDKMPLIKWGRLATADPATFGEWLKIWPECGIAIALPRNVVVVDLDCKDKLDGFKQYCRLSGTDPDDVMTAQSTTPSGGRYLWFDADGHVFTNRTGLASARAGHPGGWKSRRTSAWSSSRPPRDARG